MTIRQTPSSERIKALMRQTTASVNVAAPATTAVPTTATRPQPPPVHPSPTSPTVIKSDIGNQSDEIRARGSWNRITVRLTAGEIQKINDVVIATQQANRQSKVTTTDILRAALRRVKDQEAIDAREIKALRARDGRFAKGGDV